MRAVIEKGEGKRISPPSDPNVFLDDVEAANLLGLSRSYLKKLRLAGGGPPFASFGRAIRYRVADLYSWAAEKTIRSTSEREVA